MSGEEGLNPYVVMFFLKFPLFSVPAVPGVRHVRGVVRSQEDGAYCEYMCAMCVILASHTTRHRQRFAGCGCMWAVKLWSGCSTRSGLEALMEQNDQSGTASCWWRVVVK